MVLHEPYDSFGPMQAAGVYNSLGQYLEEYGDRMTEFARFFIEMGSRLTTEDYMRAEGRIAELKASVPAGSLADGLPIGLQIIGRRFDEETVLAVRGVRGGAAVGAAAAGCFLRREGWSRRPPTL